MFLGEYIQQKNGISNAITVVKGVLWQCKKKPVIADTVSQNFGGIKPQNSR